KPRFKVSSNIKASIIIPIRDKVELLKQLVSSIEEKSTWLNYEIIIIDNGSVLDCTLKYLRELQLDNKFKVINDNSNFNWSKVNNLGATIATGEVFVFLNNDTIVISENWLESLLSWAQLPDVAVVGPQLLYEDDTLQHAGIVVGMGGWADHIFKSEKQMHKVGPFVSPVINRNVLAVTGACQVIERTKFEMLGGFDENFEICGSDVELCIRAHKEGYQNVYLADTVLYHLESKSRSSFVPENDFALSKLKYEPYRKEGVDPFFNPNLDMMSSTPTVKL
ncbi:glycosyltransferase family 2 protein, partial [Vibrio splendidus]